MLARWVVAIAALIVAVPALAGERDQLDACKSLIATQATGAPDTPEVKHCRQIVKEWALRDARMSVDEQGKPLR